MIDIIIPNYNGAHLIEKNLPKVIEALSLDQGKIIVVDDGKTIYEKIRVMEGKKLLPALEKPGHPG